LRLVFSHHWLADSSDEAADAGDCAVYSSVLTHKRWMLLQAPFVPFLTEHIYQNLRHLIDPESTKGIDTRSVHYLMLPQPKSVAFINPLLVEAAVGGSSIQI